MTDFDIAKSLQEMGKKKKEQNKEPKERNYSIRKAKSMLSAQAGWRIKGA